MTPSDFVEMHVSYGDLFSVVWLLNMGLALAGSLELYLQMDLRQRDSGVMGPC